MGNTFAGREHQYPSEHSATVGIKRSNTQTDTLIYANSYANRGTENKTNDNNNYPTFSRSSYRNDRMRGTTSRYQRSRGNYGCTHEHGFLGMIKINKLEPTIHQFQSQPLRL